MICHDDTLVLKCGYRVRYSEEVALKLVKQYTSVPVPKIIFPFSSNEPGKGTIGMNFIPGFTLKSMWDKFDERTKEQICHEIWSMIAQWRQIRPVFCTHQCLADGSAATTDLLLKDLEDPPRPLDTDEAVRLRIYERYLDSHGTRYADTLLDMLPRSRASIFTHADVAPRNILVDKDGHITGIIDWERAGWYPDYWEYANIMKPSSDADWQKWMDQTAPQQWDLSGIDAARRVLLF